MLADANGKSAADDLPVRVRQGKNREDWLFPLSPRAAVVPPRGRKQK